MRHREKPELPASEAPAVPQQASEAAKQRARRSVWAVGTSFAPASGFNSFSGPAALSCKLGPFTCQDGIRVAVIAFKALGVEFLYREGQLKRMPTSR